MVTEAAVTRTAPRPAVPALATGAATFSELRAMSSFEHGGADAMLGSPGTTYHDHDHEPSCVDV